MKTSMILVPKLFHRLELKLLRKVMSCLRDDTANYAIVKDSFERLLHLGEVVESFPSLYESSSLSGHLRNSDTLVERLTKVDRYLLPFQMPVKARLATDFVLAKIQAFRAGHLALERASIPEAAALRNELETETSQAIYTLLAAELLLNIILDHASSKKIMNEAGQWLIRFWDNSVGIEIDDFCPLLQSAWQARNQLVVDFGSLMGSIETLRLLAAASDPEFMGAFYKEDCPDVEEQAQAFEEFLFGLSYEQLNLLKQEMELQGLTVVDREWVAQSLNVPVEELFSGITSPETMYAAYQKRYLAASLRRQQNASGPHRTAESFLMRYLLER